MAKPNKNKNKSKNGKSDRKSAPAPAPSRVVKTSAVRNTPVPKGARRTIADGASAASSKPLTHEMIAERAYFISLSENGGSEHDNWVRAERELRGI